MCSACCSCVAEDRQAQARLAALLQGLKELGWVAGRDLQIEIRWGASPIPTFGNMPAELVMLAPDVIFASGSVSMGMLSQTVGVDAVHRFPGWAPQGARDLL